VIEHFSRFVAEAGYDVTVLLYRSEVPKPFADDTNGRQFIRIPLPGSPFGMRSRRAFTASVADFLSRNDFSIVHFHNSCEYFGIVKLLTSCNARFVFHNTTHPVSDSRIRIAKRKLVESLQCLLMDAVVVQSEELRDKLPIVKKLSNSVVIPVGYNGRLFHSQQGERAPDVPEPSASSLDRLVVVYAGSMAHYRQLDRLMEGFALAKRMKGNLQLLMIGGGAAMGGLQSLARTLGVEEDVVFTGMVPHERMVDYLRTAHIGLSFVPMTESYNYNPPLKTYEYLACSLPVIATRTVSNSKIVTEGLNGVLIDDSAEGLKEGLLRLAGNPALMERMKTNAARSVEEFDFEKITQKMLIPLYLNLLKSGGNGR
jgi:glycosyltransferase involved in cell wall biosynthesis